MALGLEIGTVTQSNDNKVLYIEDGTGVYNAGTNPTGWGTPNTAFADVNGSTSDLSIQITITTSDGEETVYQAIDFYDYNGSAPSGVSDIVFALTCADLLDDDDVALGTSDDEFPDGWYDITYTITKDLVGGGGDTDTDTGYKLVCGQVRNKIYLEHLAVPFHTVLSFSDKVYNDNSHVVMFPLYLASLFESMNAFVTASRQTEILSILETLENLTD